VSAHRLYWRSCRYDRTRIIKGTELAVALLGPHNRFALYEVRCLDVDGKPDVTFYVRDAGSVSDDELAAGKRPSIVFRSDDVEQCIAFCGSVTVP
jgi:hypothetical protein